MDELLIIIENIVFSKVDEFYGTDKMCPETLVLNIDHSYLDCFLQHLGEEGGCAIEFVNYKIYNYAANVRVLEATEHIFEDWTDLEYDVDIADCPGQGRIVYPKGASVVSVICKVPQLPRANRQIEKHLEDLLQQHALYRHYKLSVNLYDHAIEICSGVYRNNN